MQYMVAIFCVIVVGIDKRVKATIPLQQIQSKSKTYSKFLASCTTIPERIELTV